MRAGTTLNHYRILAKLGEGGMGQVYRAQDTTLQREVAIKVLSPAMAADTELLARMEREARLLAQLNHPNIAAIFGLERDGDTRFLVMELAPGRTLDDVVREGPVPVDAAMKCALQVAEALEAAHDKGIIHRDLKPANIIVSTEGTQAGQVKVLDFGLAKALDPRAGGAARATELSASPTMLAGTMAGVILGTAAYMSPEQARGAAVDRRADIWAFGCVLYEMLAGRRAFDGATVTDIIANLVHRQPDIAALPSGTPARVRELLRRCLDKDARTRLRDIGEARVTIARVLAGDGGAEEASLAASAPATWQRWLPWALVPAAAVLGWLLLPGAAPDDTARVRRYTLEPVIDGAAVVAPAITRDGRRVAFERGGQLWTREFDAFEARPLTDTQEAAFPFWSPDGQTLAYFKSGTLWRVEVAGGEPTAIGPYPGALSAGMGGTWSDDGRIVIAPDAGPLLEVSARGGVPRPLFAAGPDELDYHEPWFVPGTSRLVYGVHSRSGTDAIETFEGGQRRELLRVAESVLGRPQAMPDGYLTFEGELNAITGVWAARLGADGLALTEEPFVVVMEGRAPSRSLDGTLAFVQGSGTPASDVLKVDPQDPQARTWLIAHSTETNGMGVGSAAQPVMSPDGRLLVVAARGERSRNADIVVVDLQRGVATRVLEGSQDEVNPKLSPDGRLLAYEVHDGLSEGMGAIHVMPLDGSAPPRELAAGLLGGFTPDGEGIVYSSRDEDAGRRLWYLGLAPGAAPAPLPATERPAIVRVSPDGRLYAWSDYGSEGTDGEGVFVARYPDGAERRQVDRSRVVAPDWAPDGRALFYWSDRELARVGVDAGSGVGPIGLTPRQVLGISGPGFSSPRPPFDVARFAVAADGDIIMTQPTTANLGASAGALRIVQNWPRDLAAPR